MKDAAGPSIPAAYSGPSYDLLLSTLDEQGRIFDDPGEYYQGVVTALVERGPFQSLAVWLVSEDGVIPQAVAPENHPQTGLPEVVVDRALGGKSAVSSAILVDGGGELSRIVASYRMMADEAVVLDGMVRPTEAGEQPRWLLEAAAELVGHFCLRVRYRAARGDAERIAQINSALLRLRRGESASQSAMAIVETLQEGLGYDRGWLCAPGRGGAVVIATAATADVGHRRELVREVRQLASRVLRQGQDLVWLPGEGANALDRHFSRLADEGAARRIETLIFFRDDERRKPCACVILEGFSAEIRPVNDKIRPLLTAHAELSVREFLLKRGAGLRGIVRRMDSWAWGRLIVGAATLAGVSAWLSESVPFELEVEGRLMPVEIRSVFAPSDGIVAEISCDHGQAVGPGDTLLVLQDQDLDTEREKLRGQLAEYRAKRSSMQWLRAQGRRAASELPVDFSLQEEQLNISIDSTEKQLTLVEKQYQQLKVESPIRGIVDRWDLRDVLTARPVVRGQYLLDVLNPDGAWQLELGIPDQDISYVLHARANQHSPLSVRYALRTEPLNVHHTALARVGERTELNEQEQLVVRGFASVQPESLLNRRTGASVLAHVNCGNRSRAFWWFHEVIEYVQRKWLM